MTTLPRSMPSEWCSVKSVVVAVPAEGLHGLRTGAGPLRNGTAGLAPGRVPVGVRAPVPTGFAPLGPTVGVDLPRLAAAVRRHVEQAHGPVDRFVAPARRGVGEEHAVTVEQVAGDRAHAVADRSVQTAHRVPGFGVAHELDVGGHLVGTALGQYGVGDAAGVEVDGVL